MAQLCVVAEERAIMKTRRVRQFKSKAWSSFRSLRPLAPHQPLLLLRPRRCLLLLRRPRSRHPRQHHHHPQPQEAHIIYKKEEIIGAEHATEEDDGINIYGACSRLLPPSHVSNYCPAGTLIVIFYLGLGSVWRLGDRRMYWTVDINGESQLPLPFQAKDVAIGKDCAEA